MSSLDVRPENPDEIAAISVVVESAFGGDEVPILLSALRESSAWRDLSFVATLDDAIVGHLALTRGWLDAPRQLVEVLVLSPMSVHPDFQKRGIGKALLERTLIQLRDRPEPLVFLEGNPAFYSRAGFLPGGPAGFIAPSLRIPARAFQFHPLPSYEPWMTGTLVYPDVFWQHDAVGLR